MNYVRVKSYAKINLTLDVTGVSGGYHLIDSVVASVDLSDLIAVKKRKDKLVSIIMHGCGSESIEFSDNNAVKAAERFIEKYGTCGADITVWKNIPVGAGLGGSSADVAGVLNAMCKLYGVDDSDGVKSIADGIGSDCGYMLTGGYARLTGRGETVERIDGGLKLDIGLLIPKGGVSTRACYALCDRLGYSDTGASGLARQAIISGDKQLLGSALCNALTKPAVYLNGGVGEAVEELKQFAPLGVNMTGSGSGVYALFENDQFLSYASSRYRGKFAFIATKTVTPFKEDK